MLFLCHILQNPVDLKKKKKISEVRFEVKKKLRNQKKVPKLKPKPKKQSRKTKSLKPRLDLAFAGGGIDLGIDIIGLSAADSSLLSQGDSVMTEDVVDQLPKIQYREPIPFPEEAKENGLGGYVTANVLVDKSGRVDKVKLLDANPVGVFENVALAGLKKWTFSPAEYQGRFVSVWIKQRVKFQVN